MTSQKTAAEETSRSVNVSSNKVSVVVVLVKNTFKVFVFVT